MPSPKLPALLTRTVLTRDGRRCVFCERTEADGAVLTVDHVVPRVWGGSDRLDNLVCCCRRCNELKGTMDHIAYADMLERYGLVPSARAIVARVLAALATPAL